MASTFISAKLHVVFGTRGRQPLITRELRPRLFPFLGGIVRALGGKALIVNGVSDHVHALIDLPSGLSIADLVRTMKSNSSAWIHEKFDHRKKFHWQTGYGAFSVSPSVVPRVIRYIEEQEEHHRRVTYAEEVAQFLRETGLEYDERYLAG